MGGFTLGGGGGALVAVATGGAGAPAVPAGAYVGAGLGATAGLVAGKSITNALFNESAGEGGGTGERNWRQDRRLSKGEIKKLQDAELDPHEIKADALGTNENLSKYDLFKSREGDIYVKPKNGVGEGEATGLNIHNF